MHTGQTKPTKEGDWHLGTTASLASDIESEHGYPDHIIIFKDPNLLNEKSIVQWMESWEPTYNLFHTNCISAIKSAFRAGGLKKWYVFEDIMNMRKKFYPDTSKFAKDVPFEFMISNACWQVQLIVNIYIGLMDITKCLLLIYYFTFLPESLYFLITIIRSDVELILWDQAIIQRLRCFMNGSALSYLRFRPSSRLSRFKVSDI